MCPCVHLSFETFTCNLVTDVKIRDANRKTSPFEVKIEATSENLQMELIELQGTSELKSKYKETDIIQFYKLYIKDDGSYPGLVQHTKM